jgi:Domain of unknown function (DUF4832)
LRILLLLLSPVCFLIIGCSSGLSQDNLFKINLVPMTDFDVNRPGAGAEQWIGQNTVNIPVEGVNTPRLDAYYRFNWLQFQPYEAKPDEYDFTVFDAQVNDAISKGQKFSFGIMTICSSCGGGTKLDSFVLQYPLFLHNQMQSEKIHDWGSSMSGLWVPNWNSNAYLSALENLNFAINNHIKSSSFNGVPYSNIIGYIDIRQYGNWGEWHHSSIVKNWSDFPDGTAATTLSLKRLIDAHVNYFKDFPLVILIGAFEAQQLPVAFNVPAEIGYYALTRSNNAGKIGWRRDNWGWTDNYIFSFTTNNHTVYKGLNFGDEISNRYKYAQVVGEPADLGLAWYKGVNFGDLVNQIKTAHANSFGNGNLDKSVNDKDARLAYREASKTAGYRLVVESGNMTKSLNLGAPFTISLNWKNLGVAPTYENWNVMFELRNAKNEMVWSGKSAFKLKLFLPQRESTVSQDKINLPAGLPPGSYNLYLTIRDPLGYRQPLPLAVQGRNADGSYLLRSNILLGTSGPSNQ